MRSHITKFDRIEQYLAHRQNLGFGIEDLKTLLRSFVVYANRRSPAAFVTTSAALEWATGSKPISPSTQARRLSVVRNFARYCTAFDPRTEIPPPKLLGSGRRRAAPYIYSMTEIQTLLKAARTLRPANALRPHTYTVLIGLIASTGIRVGEAIRLGIDDVRWKESALVIRNSKRVKERLVPLHSSALAALQAYAQLRSAYLAESSISSFFITDWGKPLNRVTVRHIFGQLCVAAGIGDAKRRRPRIHDLRHTFACRRLLQWHKDGLSLDAGMMSLSAYLGHVEPTNTYWYLTAIPELLDACGKRFEQQSLRRLAGGHRP